MIILDDQKIQMEGFRKILDDAKESLRLDELREEKRQLEEKMGADDFWDNVEEANKVTSQVKRLNAKIESTTIWYHNMRTLQPSWKWHRRRTTKPTYLK